MNHCLGILLAAGLLMAIRCQQPSHGAEIVRLTEKTWDEYAPRGKEVDCIYGDFVLRNGRIVVVIAAPGPVRNANMTVKGVGGMIIDLTRADAPNDQLSCYYANAMPMEYRDPTRVKIRAGGQSAENHPDLKITAGKVQWEASGVASTGLEVTTRYSLSDGQDWLVADTEIRNPSGDSIAQELSDSIRADKTFQFGVDEATGLFFADDDFFQQCYGVMIEGRSIRQTGSRNSVLELLDKSGSAKAMIKAGESLTISRKIIPGANLLEVRKIANLLGGVVANSLMLAVDDPLGPVANAKVTLTLNGQPFGTGRTRDDGSLSVAIPVGKMGVTVEAIGRDRRQVEIPLKPESNAVKIKLKSCGYVVADITDESDGPIPCKVAFHGQGETPSPDYGPDTADSAVRNLVYSHHGRFRQAIGPGRYEVIISLGPEYDAVFSEITVERGQDTKLEAKLRRVVDTSGWVSADFHSHSTPSGDNTSSQLGRVQNLLCEHVEFCPCTEHNRIDSYVPWLKKLGVEHLMATCSGMELTGQVLPVNHQNAFPLLHKPRLQDGGGPPTDVNPVVQIERLALWDGGSDKLVQENHPNIVQVLTDKDEDGKFDGGFAKMLDYMDVIEVHPLQSIFTPPTRGADGKLTRSPTFHWMQLLNLGYRIPGVSNTDAHYNYHGSGWIRDYLKSPTDNPAKIDTAEMVHAAERGNLVMTTGPFLDVSLQAKQESSKRRGIPGDDVVAPGGDVQLQVRVQCANWLDINRVQIFLNGRPEKSLNFTRRDNGDRFQNGVTKFEATLPMQLKRDTHVIVAAIGEGLQLGRVMGPEFGTGVPVAVANPIFVDLEGDGFKPNGDLLDVALPK